MREAWVDLVILDCPRVRDVIHDVDKVADYVVSPARSTYLDLLSTRDAIHLVQMVGSPFGVVLNFCSHGVPDTAQTVEIMARMGASVVPAKLHLRTVLISAKN